MVPDYDQFPVVCNSKYGTINELESVPIRRTAFLVSRYTSLARCCLFRAIVRKCPDGFIDKIICKFDGQQSANVWKYLKRPCVSPTEARNLKTIGTKNSYSRGGDGIRELRPAEEFDRSKW